MCKTYTTWNPEEMGVVSNIDENLFDALQIICTLHVAEIVKKQHFLT